MTRVDGRWRAEGEDRLAVEEPLEIRLGGQSVSVVMRTPGDDDELAVGLLFTEGILSSPDELADVRHSIDPRHPDLCNLIDVTPKTPIDLASRGWQRSFVSASSCGLCGKQTIASIHLHAPPIEDDLRVSTDVLYALPDALSETQPGFEETGGIHAAGLFEPDGTLLIVREDIGRHNAVDKVVGAALFAGLYPLSGKVLLVSGRASFEIVQKALVARIPFVAAVSAASSLAVELAETSSMGLVGFLRGRSANVYAGAHRVLT